MLALNGVQPNELVVKRLAMLGCTGGWSSLRLWDSRSITRFHHLFRLRPQVAQVGMALVVTLRTASAPTLP